MPAVAPTPGPTVAPAASAPVPSSGAGQGASAWLYRLPWVASASLIGLVAVGVPIVLPYGGLLAQVDAATRAAEQVSLERGAALADAVGNRNAIGLAEQRADVLDVKFVLDRPGVRLTTVADTNGVVLAPSERLRSNVSRHPAFQTAQKESDVAMEPLEDGTWEIVAPVRADITGSGARQLVGYALIEYDPGAIAREAYNPTARLVVGLLATLVSIAALVYGAWALVLRPLALLREETELAARGAAEHVAPPVRLPQMEALTHSINRVVARLRSR